jgi:Domain of unknown function (DUF4136)
MNVQKALSVLVLGFALTATSFAQTVKTDFDRNTNFSRYKTYSWHLVEMKNPLWVDRIKSVVNAELAKKGWTEVATGGDASIGAVGISRDQSTVRTFYNGMEGYRWEGFGDNYIVKDTKEGTLVISIFDNDTKRLVWVGSSMNVVSDKSKKNIKNLNKGVQEMFEHFPPEPQS